MEDPQRTQPDELSPEEARLVIEAIGEAEREEATQTQPAESPPSDPEPTGNV